MIGIERQPKTKAEREAFLRLYGKPPIRYNYCQSLAPKYAYCILLDFNGRCAQIVFEGSDLMAQHLREYIRSRKESENGIY
jgi:hypothetical protein